MEPHLTPLCLSLYHDRIGVRFWIQLRSCMLRFDDPKLLLTIFTAQDLQCLIHRFSSTLHDYTTPYSPHPRPVFYSK